ncbi:MAG TPA: LPS export ABC transporter periplasmic protein LptC [Terriglobales bacterium]|nr:LPS export ABC transporter periplasmic protein LptC [Terriglobales bacterium]
MQILHLRRWFALGAIGMVLLVVGMYLYARHRVRNALKEVPQKIGIDVQQTAQGFTVSRSEQGHTLFKIQASKAIQFKQGGRAELHDVEITLYGRDSSRFDQIYGSDFIYDPASGEVTAQGEVQIDLEANPQGLTKPDQAAPKELKDPLHLKTTGLTFNQKTGNASTREKVEFEIPQASGSAMGASYVADTSVLTLQSQVNMAFTGTTPARVTAAHATIKKNPHIVVLDHPHVENGPERAEAQNATLFLRPDNSVDRVLATGEVKVEASGTQSTQVQSAQLELVMMSQQGSLKAAIFSGDVQMQSSGAQQAEGSAGRLLLTFSGKNVLTTAHTEQNVNLVAHQKPASGSTSAQDVELTAPVVDFVVANGSQLERAETSGASQIAIRPSAPNAGQQTLVTAMKFVAKFDNQGQLSSVHGAPDAHIVTTNPGQPDRVSTSDTLDASFRPPGGIQAITQQGRVAYVDGERKAWAEYAKYTPADQVLVLTGSPRVVDGSMTTTARSMRLNRATGDAFADGDVKSTYSDLKAQPGGALLASSSPIHVTARAMLAHRGPAVADYTGNARLWQDANIVEAPSIKFDRDQRSVVAQASASQMVSTVLMQADKSGKVTPVTITSTRLSYTDNERKAHFDGAVQAKGADVTITANQMDVYLQSRGQAAATQATAAASRVDHIVASGRVLVSQPGRSARGNQLVYTADEDKFVLTGGPPSIFDAEHGKITGVSLTFFRHDDRVLVEGSDKSPTVTQTRVAR